MRQLILHVKNLGRTSMIPANNIEIRTVNNAQTRITARLLITIKVRNFKNIKIVTTNLSCNIIIVIYTVVDINTYIEFKENYCVK